MGDTTNKDFSFGDLISKEADKIEITLKTEEILRLHDFYKIVISENKVQNLIGPLEPGQIVKFLFIDSILGLKAIPKEENLNVVDVGTGGGFPGMVLKILRPDLKMNFLDSSAKKIDFLRTACQSLNLKDVDFINERAENAGKSPNFREKFNIALSKAVADLPVLLELCAPLIAPKGKLIAWKGNKYKDETYRTGEKHLLLGLSNPEILTFPSLSADDNREGNTRLLVFEKIFPTPLRYPRSYQAIKRGIQKALQIQQNI